MLDRAPRAGDRVISPSSGEELLVEEVLHNIAVCKRDDGKTKTLRLTLIMFYYDFKEQTDA